MCVCVCVGWHGIVAVFGCVVGGTAASAISVRLDICAVIVEKAITS